MVCALEPSAADYREPPWVALNAEVAGGFVPSMSPKCLTSGIGSRRDVQRIFYAICPSCFFKIG